MHHFMGSTASGSSVSIIKKVIGNQGGLKIKDDSLKAKEVILHQDLQHLEESQGDFTPESHIKDARIAPFEVQQQ